jgi:hypothetical protein
MSHRLPSLFAIGAFIGCCIASVATSAATTHNPPVTSSAPQPPGSLAPSPRAAPAAVHQQMHALEYQAGVKMILYKGRFGNGDLASMKPDLDAVALTLKYTDN